jgi:hypothetical protein
MIAGVPTEVRTEGDNNERQRHADMLSEDSVCRHENKRIILPRSMAGWLVGIITQEAYT